MSALEQVDRRLGYLLPPRVRQELLDRYRWQRQRRGVSWRRARPLGDGPRVRIGFVGAGTYAQHHLKVLSSLPGVSISSLLTTGGPRGRAAAARFGIERTFTDADDFAGQPAIDCFVVVVPATQTKSVVSRCLRAGKPVLLEKPPGTSAADTAELADCAERHQTFGMVCMNRRYYSVIEHGMAALASCGPLRGATMEVPQPVTQDRSSGRLAEGEYEHFFVRNSIHGVDLLRYILGEPLSVHSLTWPNPEFGNAAASFASVWEYDHGVVATTTDLWDTPPLWRLKVVAEQGWVELQPFERGWFVNHRGWRARLRTDRIDRRFRPGVLAQDAHFCDAVRRGEPPTMPACLLPDAHRTMLLVEQILAGGSGVTSSSSTSSSTSSTSSSSDSDRPAAAAGG